jgi:hypothetical protein|tara:strand:+ start:581 stop:796 length:216 start_codon:yes stop_codon:yes gene_type:complete
MDSFIYYLVYSTDDNNRSSLMVKIIYFSGMYKGYTINKPRKAAELWVCNCVDGHQNCKCDGKTGKKVRNDK